MKKRIKERSIIFYSVLKWVTLSVVVGCMVGVSTAIFLKALNRSSVVIASHQYYFLLLPFALFISAFIIKFFAPDAEGHGTEKVIEAIHKNDGIIKAAVVPVKLVATIITIAFGGSAVKRGPALKLALALLRRLPDYSVLMPTTVGSWLSAVSAPDSLLS